jgi:hypothetical protein
MNMAGEDFVAVKLSAKGEKIAKGTPVTIVDGQHTFVFNPGETQEHITKAFDWEQVLSKQFADGEPLFEIVE